MKKLNEVKEKAKTYWNENKEVIVKKHIPNLIVTELVCITCYMIGRHSLGVKPGDMVITEDSINTVFKDIHKMGDAKVHVFTGIMDEPILTNELGKLGKIMMDEIKVPDNADFTHFVLVGKNK